MISGLHHYALEVPDLAVAEGFLQDFGLETGEKDGALVARCPGRRRIEDDAAWAPRTFDPAEPGSIDMWLGPTARPVTQPQLRSATPAEAASPAS